MIIELSPELEARVHEWGREFNRPCEELAVELLEEYFEDSDTGARISQAVRGGESEIYSWDTVKSSLHEMADWACPQHRTSQQILQVTQCFVIQYTHSAGVAEW